MNSKNKSGGGVVMNLVKNLNYTVLECTTAVVDDLLKSVKIEISIGKKQKYNNWLHVQGNRVWYWNFQGLEGGNVFKNKSEGTFFICGDFNIDLLNPNKQKKKMTAEFINTLFRGINVRAKTWFSGTTLGNILWGKGYWAFFRIFRSLYDSDCPVKQ